MSQPTATIDSSFWKRLQRVIECLIVVVIVAALAGLLLLGRGTRRAEWRVGRWEPSLEDRQTPTAEYLNGGKSVVGEWVRGGMDSEHLLIEERDDKSLDVHFSTSGCIDRWTLERTATQSGATMVYDRPVVAYGSRPYDRMYLVSYRELDFLLPGDRVSDFNRAVAENDQASWVSRLALMRPSERKRIDDNNFQQDEVMGRSVFE